MELYDVLYRRNLKHFHNKEEVRNSKIVEVGGNIVKRIIKGIIPIAIASYIAAILMTTENVLIPTMLRKSGVSATLAISQYGMVKGMILPLLFFPAAFLTAFSTTLIPEIARAHTANNRKRVISLTNRVMHLTFLLGIIVTTLFIGYAHEIANYVYHNDYLESLIRVLAWIVPVMYIEVIADGILKGLGRQMNSLTYSVADSFLRITLICLLLPMKGMKGFLMMMVLSNLLTSTLNFNKVITITEIEIPVIRWIVQPIMAAVAAMTFGKLLLGRLMNGLPFTSTRLLGELIIIVGVYISLLLVMGNISNLKRDKRSSIRTSAKQ